MKIDIENYESMSPEEKIAALEANFASVAQHKANADKAASEAANYKKQLRERMTEDEAKAVKAAEEHAALIERAEKAERELGVINYEKAYLAMGYDENLARSSAEALARGDMESVFKNQKIYSDARDKALRTELLKQTPPPAAGASATSISKEAFDAMGYKERVALFNENPELYKQLNGGNE